MRYPFHPDEREALPRVGAHALHPPVPSYRPGQVNHCPSCARSHWLIGRLTAECAFCGSALPIATGAPPQFRWLPKAA